MLATTESGFWAHHGLVFLVGLTVFPRLTVWFASAITGGFWFWAAFLLWPRLVIAVIAAVFFWKTNPVLVVAAIVVAVSGESTEKKEGYHAISD